MTILRQGPVRLGLINSEVLRYLGPAVLVGVGYMDPGNWGTDIAAGAIFGYGLLWVVLMSSAIGIFVQYLSAKLGMATRRTLSQNCRDNLSGHSSFFLWLTAEIAAIGTDLAEVIGGALAIHLLTGLPLFAGALITGLDVLLILSLQRWGYRKLEAVVMGFVAAIGFSFVYLLYAAGPDWSSVAYHSVIPELQPASIMIAVGILGATVMPHNVFLHSSLVQTRLSGGIGAGVRKLTRFALADTLLALTVAGLINSAILIMSATVFRESGLRITSIEEAHRALTPLLGGFSSLVFAVALLFSGLSSSTTATLAGQVIIEGFLRIRIRLWLRRLVTRLVTLVPALIAIGLGVEPLRLLVTSQIILSMQLPFTIIPLILFTRRRDLMREYVNRRATDLIAILVTFLIVSLNSLLLFQVLTGQAV